MYTKDNINNNNTSVKDALNKICIQITKILKISFQKNVFIPETLTAWDCSKK